MDRDNRWDRVEKAYRALVYADGRRFKSAEEAVAKAPGNVFSSAVLRPPFISSVSLWESSDAAMEAFLAKAKIVSITKLGIGTTNSRRATLSDGTLTHDAHVQIVDRRERVRHSRSRLTGYGDRELPAHLEGDLERHVEDKVLGRVVDPDDVGHHPRALVQVDPQSETQYVGDHGRSADSTGHPRGHRQRYSGLSIAGAWT